MSPSVRNPLAAAAAVFVMTAVPAAASVFGDVRGQVVDPQSRPIPQAKVELRADGSGFVRDVETDAAGAFRLRAIPLGEYVLKVEAQGFARAERRVTVVTDSAPLVQVRMAIATLTETTEVVAPAVASDAVTPKALVDKEDISAAPGATARTASP